MIVRRLHFVLAALFVFGEITLDASNDNNEQIFINQGLVKYFYTCVQQGQVDQVEKMLQKNAQLANMSLGECNSPLFVTQDKHMIDLLLKNKSSPYCIHPTYQWSPFFYSLIKAWGKNDFTIPQLFIDHDVDLSFPHDAISNQVPLFVRIMRPCSFGTWNMVTTWFVQSCKDPNIKDSRGQSILYWALFYKRLKEAKILLKRKADPNVKDIFGESPFTITLKKYAMGRVVIDELILLLSYGGDPKARYNKESLIHFFFRYGKDELQDRLAWIFAYLIEKDVDPFELDVKGVSPQKKAEELGDEKIIQLFKELKKK